jgi:hypothetical protein
MELYGTFHYHWRLGFALLPCWGRLHFIVQYDKSKVDQTGEKVSDKNIYDNPFDPLGSVFIA